MTAADFTIYECAPLHDFGWVTDKEYFEDDYYHEPVTTVRRRYRLIDETKMTWHPRGMLCAICNGDEELCLGVENGQVCGGVTCRWNHDQCPRCNGAGTDPDAGTWKETT